jgi:TetR/AcrR family transcriptional regulator, transcriptional repressor of bet genes
MNERSFIVKPLDSHAQLRNPLAKGDAMPDTRDSARDRQRLKMIEATADAILDHGLAGVSVARILDRAGLSRGMINLHFDSKDRLLVETARHFGLVYLAHWDAALAGAGPDPAQRLRALIAADFAPEVLNRRTIAVWFAFRAEATSTPAYMPHVDSRDARVLGTLRAICTALADPPVDPGRAALAFMAMLEGFWTDFHLHPDRFDRAEAQAVALEMARAFFPRHFA